MSKFFNETLKIRNSAAQEAVSKQADFQELVGTAFSPSAATVSSGGGWLDECRKIENPLTDLLKAQFKGSDSVESVLESYRALRTRLLRISSQEGLKSVVITSASQGEGKTFTSLNLASCCARLHEMRVLLIDGDIRSRGLSRRLESLSGPGLSEVLAGKCDPEDAILATDIPNLYVLTAGSPTIPAAELFAGPGWQELIEWSNQSFKLVLVDSPPVLNLADVELMTVACDGVLMVVRAQQTKRDVLQKTTSQLDPKKLLGVVYNAAESSSTRYQYPSPGAKET
jgi:capsular exopolysaccharide synthesis family protein